jgi:3-deoxy-D-manno-octulosonate 8-phosphate phosphatase (KDO 8-P phosphatase)
MIKNKIEDIKWLFTDVDGVLTDGGVYVSERGEEFKKFNLRDGMGAERLRKHTEIQIAIMTGENSGPVVARAKKLKIDTVFLGIKDKLSEMTNFVLQNNLKFENIAYIGDDFNDFDVIQKVGLSATPADGIEELKNIVDYACSKKGGEGAFREFCEFIIKHK